MIEIALRRSGGKKDNFFSDFFSKFFKSTAKSRNDKSVYLKVLETSIALHIYF
tara:strand:- start:432 stop:590 length:159 start_codon:yes stop_codon:yes gene_type:complete